MAEHCGVQRRRGRVGSRRRRRRWWSVERPHPAHRGCDPSPSVGRLTSAPRHLSETRTTVYHVARIYDSAIHVDSYSAPPGGGVRSIAMSVPVCLSFSVCLSARISKKRHVQTSRNFQCMYLWLMIGPSLTTIQCYVLPVFQMTSCLPIMGHMVRG